MENTHESLVNRAVFQQANRLLEGESRGHSKQCQDERPYLLSGLVRRGRCGRPMEGRPRVASTTTTRAFVAYVVRKIHALKSVSRSEAWRGSSCAAFGM